MSERSRRVFSLQQSMIGHPMKLTETPGQINAYDSTGALVATAKWMPQDQAWGIIQRLPFIRVVGHRNTKDKAIYALRRIVGELS